MHDQMNNDLREIERLARMERYQEALLRIDALAASHPNQPTVWAARGYVNGRQGDLSAAVSDLTRCISLRENEPNDFFTRGRFLFRAGKYNEAISDFSRVLQLCDSYNSDYYRQAAYFFRADAYVRLKEHDKARADCRNVVDRGPIWTDKLRTVDEILDECG
jgi:tetratricopeptide (TPR) repeat protein